MAVDDATTTEPAATARARDDSPWLTPREAAARAKCGVKLLYASVRAGKLRAVRLGARNDIRIHTDWLDAWMAAATIINPNAPGADVPLPIAFQNRRKG